MTTMIVNMGERVLFMDGAVWLHGKGSMDELKAAVLPVKKAPASEALTAGRRMPYETYDVAGGQGGMHCNDPS